MLIFRSVCSRVWISRERRWRTGKRCRAINPLIHVECRSDICKRVVDRIVVARVQLGDVSSCSAVNRRQATNEATFKCKCPAHDRRPSALERHAASHGDLASRVYVFETVVRTDGIGS